MAAVPVRAMLAGETEAMPGTSMTTPTDDQTGPLPLAAGFPAASRAQWLALVENVLKGQDFRKRLVSRTTDGLEIEPLYTRVDAEGPATAAPDGVPGAMPFTRGSALRAASAGWHVAQLRAEPDPTAMAAAIADDAGGGADAVTIRLAAPGQSGLPAEFRAIEAALAGLPAGSARVSLQPGSHAIHGALALSRVMAGRGALSSVGCLGIDPLGTLARTGELILMRTDGQGFALGLPWLPRPVATLIADAGPYHEAGGSEAQELAALAATLVAYLRCCEGEGMRPADALPRIALSLAADADLFLGMAKLRAARRIVWRIASACGAGEAAGQMRLAVTTSARMMTRRDPWVNMLRVTAATAAAAMGGADEITVLPFTWALGRPDTFASRIARNVGLVLREESALGRVVDPAGGAWHAERLSDDLARKAWGILQEWEGEGGMLAALRSGLVQDQIAAVAEARDRQIATGRMELTGTSAFPLLGDDGVKAEPWPEPLAPSGESVARPLLPRRLAAPFERLRDRADALPGRPRVFLASLGTLAEHAARSTWITNFLAAGGIGVVSSEGFTASADAGRAFAASGARVACLCSTDAVYAELGEATAMALKGAGAARIYLAGRPRAGEAALRAAGVDGFIFSGCDAIATLEEIMGAA